MAQAPAAFSVFHSQWHHHFGTLMQFFVANFFVFQPRMLGCHWVWVVAVEVLTD